MRPFQLAKWQHAIQPIEELRPEKPLRRRHVGLGGFLSIGAAKPQPRARLADPEIRRQQNHRAGEIRHPAQRIAQPAFIQHPQ